MTKHIEIKENFTGSSQLFIKDQFLETIKVKGTFSDDEYKNSLRVYCKLMGSKGNTAFNIQLRSFGNLHHSYDKSVAKPFQTVSTIGLTIKDVEEILAFMKREEGRYGQFEEVDGNQKWVGRYEKNPHKDFHNKNVVVTEPNSNISNSNDFKSSAQIIKERDERDTKHKEQEDWLNDTRNMINKSTDLST